MPEMLIRTAGETVNPIESPGDGGWSGRQSFRGKDRGGRLDLTLTRLADRWRRRPAQVFPIAPCLGAEPPVKQVLLDAADKTIDPPFLPGRHGRARSQSVSQVFPRTPAVDLNLTGDLPIAFLVPALDEL
jgi:hypothetical protein